MTRIHILFFTHYRVTTPVLEQSPVNEHFDIIFKIFKFAHLCIEYNHDFEIFAKFPFILYIVHAMK